MSLRPESFGFDPSEQEQKVITERIDGTTDEEDEAMSEAWLAEREAEIMNRLEQLKFNELRQALENIDRDILSIVEDFGITDLSEETKEKFRQMRREQIEEIYSQHTPELVASIIGDLKVRGASGSQEEFERSGRE